MERLISCELGSQTRHNFHNTKYYINGAIGGMKGSNTLYYIFRGSVPFCMKVCQNREADIEFHTSEKLPESNFVLKFVDRIQIDSARQGLIMPVYTCTVQNVADAIEEKQNADEVTHIENSITYIHRL